jgi:hypothetical protein
VRRDRVVDSFREAMDLDRERRTQAIQSRAEYRPLLQKLKKIIEDETKKTLRPVGCQDLESCVFDVVGLFEANQKASDWLSWFAAAHDLAAPLARVIELFEQELTRDWIVAALGPSRPHRGQNQPLDDVPNDLQEIALERYRSILSDLHKIARRVPTSPARRGRGRPATSGGLYAPVRMLARYWEKLTGEHFTQYWHKGDPANNATLFVHAVIGFIEPERLRSLPKITELIVAERRVSSRK